jgi:hypothetical protein
LPSTQAPTFREQPGNWMTKRARPQQPDPDSIRLTGEEKRSVTHGEFWIPETERTVYQTAMRELNRAGVRFIISGLYAIYEYTGIYRETKDLDLFLEPRHLIQAARVLSDAGFSLRLEQPHWLAKAFLGEKQIDLIFGMGNGIALIDHEWYLHSRPGILAGTPVRVAPPEDLIWHRLYVSERHRYDMSDVVHLIVCRGHELDWKRLLARVNQHWRLLLAQIHVFDFVYPGHRSRVPIWVRDELSRCAIEEAELDGDPKLCQGTLISRFSFSIDVNEWAMRDLRAEAIHATRELPIIQEIATSDVWDSAPPADEEPPDQPPA